MKTSIVKGLIALALLSIMVYAGDEIHTARQDLEICRLTVMTGCHIELENLHLAVYGKPQE